MGDALAVALLKCRNFSSDDFSRYHPGGALGKKLYLTVRDIALQNMRPSVRADDSVQSVILEISKNRLGATAVMDGEQLAGIITDGDIRRMIEKTTDLKGIIAADIMNVHARKIEGSELAANAASIMRELKISQLVVTEGDAYIGMVHIHDLNREGIL
jgi:arabinose-5-phosphate isomerase